MQSTAVTPTSHQPELPIALVHGQPYTSMPTDLYIPPDALEVILEAFQGPLDLLLYLIKRQNLDILNIPIAEITRQYMEYVELMKKVRLELAADYLVMAAMLAEIKSRLLLPRLASDENSEEDPRAELVRRLQEYERLKSASEQLDKLPRQGRDVFTVMTHLPELKFTKPLPVVELPELLNALKEVFRRAELYAHHAIVREPLSIRERMSQILMTLAQTKFVNFEKLFSIEEGRTGIVVTFIALLELVRQSLVELIQTEPFSPIHIKALGEQ